MILYFKSNIEIDLDDQEYIEIQIRSFKRYG